MQSPNVHTVALTGTCTPLLPCVSSGVYTVPTVPDLWSEPGLWQADQHSHPHLRPADVVVYVLEEGGQAKQTVLRHLAVQATETLHAVVIVGGVCDADLG